jgi:hypothetical protein
MCPKRLQNHVHVSKANDQQCLKHLFCDPGGVTRVTNDRKNDVKIEQSAQLWMSENLVLIIVVLVFVIFRDKTEN